MTCVRRIAVFFALASFVVLCGCAMKNGGGVMYEYADGWLIREYKAPLQETYKAGMHGVYSEFMVVEEKSSEEGAAKITGELDGAPVVVDMVSSGPGSTLVSVQVTEKGDKSGAKNIHEALQRYLFL